MSRTHTIAGPLLTAAVLSANLIVVQPQAHAAQVVVSQVTTNGTKGYLEVDGNPST